MTVRPWKGDPALQAPASTGETGGAGGWRATCATGCGPRPCSCSIRPSGCSAARSGPGLPAAPPCWEPPVDISRRMTSCGSRWPCRALRRAARGRHRRRYAWWCAASAPCRCHAVRQGIHRLEMPHGRFERRMRPAGGPLRAGPARAGACGCLTLTCASSAERRAARWPTEHRLIEAALADDAASAAGGRPAAGAGAQPRAVPRHGDAGDDGPARARSPPPSRRARRAPGRHPHAARSEWSRPAPRSTCIAWARSPMSCATSPRRTARTISSARASSVSRSSSSSSGWPVLVAARRAHPGAGRRSAGDRGAVPASAAPGPGSARSCCRRRRRSWPPRSRASTSPGALADLAAAYMD